MASLNSIEERRRKSRNILLSAFIVLLIIWIVKLCSPQVTIISLYSQHASASTAISESAPHAAAANSGKVKSNPSDKIILGSDAFNGTLTTKAAVIIETRFRTNLIPLILHFSSVLGPAWPILIYTSAESANQFYASAALGRYLKSGMVQVRMLPQTVFFTNSESVNAFLTKSWLWENLAPAEHILLFQSDSMLCANAARSVDDFVDYDFVRGPIAENLGKGYNGGLSLRKRRTILNILDKWDWEETKREGDRSEDQWFLDRMMEIQDDEEKHGIKPEEEGAINLPILEVARTFSVATLDYPHPLGVHQVHSWLKEQMASLDEWCPEYHLCSGNLNA